MRHTEELAASITREQGKTLADARGDVFRGLGARLGSRGQHRLLAPPAQGQPGEACLAARVLRAWRQQAIRHCRRRAGLGQPAPCNVPRARRPTQRWWSTRRASGGT